MKPKATVYVSPLKINEYHQKPLSPFYKLFQSKLSPKNLETLTPQHTRTELEYLWLNGGYPEPLLRNSPTFHATWMDAYLEAYLYTDIARLFPKLNTFAYRRFISMLSKLSGTILNKSDIGRNLEISEGSVREYLTIADGTFIWKNIPSYEKNHIKSIIKMPKGHLTDSGIAHHLKRIQTLTDLDTDPHVGNSFESFIIEEILRGLHATNIPNWTPHFYRTRNGAEIDLILEGPFGTLPIEIKYGTTTKLKNLKSLSEFVQSNSLPFGILINQSTQVDWITRNIIQIPAGCL